MLILFLSLTNEFCNAKLNQVHSQQEQFTVILKRQLKEVCSWKQFLCDVLAMVKQLGISTYFLTLYVLT